MRRLTSLLPALAVVPLVAALLSLPAHADPGPSDPAPAGPAHTPIWDDGPGGERYVAFGDSFVSGPGIAPQRVGCLRSEKNFPTLVAQGLEARSYVDASCGGATSRDLTTSQTIGGYTNAPQLDALSADTTLVTFGTLGGNDIGLVQLAGACGEAGSCVPDGDPLADKFAGARERLVAGLRATKERAPQADIAVVGYGTYVTPGGCPNFFLGAVQPEEFDYLQSQIDRLSEMLKQVAREEGVIFIDQRLIPDAINHTVCADLYPVDKQWIRGLVTEVNGVTDGYVFHPSTAGMKAIADYVLTRIAEERRPATPTPESPEPTPAPTKAQRLAALKAKARTVRTSTSCQQKGRQVRVRVNGGKGAVSRVALRAGGRRLAVDTKAPWVLRTKAAKVRRAKGKVRVVVTVRDQQLTVTRTLRVKRPRCAR